MSQTNLFSAEWCVKQWVAWGRTGECIGYPSVTPFRRMYSNGAERQIEVSITDSEGSAIDSVISEYRKSNPKECAVMISYFRSGSSVTVARQFRISRNNVIPMVNQSLYDIEPDLQDAVQKNTG